MLKQPLFQILFLSKNSVKGFTLLETLAAAFVIIIGIAGIFGLISRLTATASLASDRLTAAYLAQEGIEIVRNIRDSNWLSDTANWNDNLVCPGGCEADYKSSALSDSYDGDYLKIDNGFYQYSPGGRQTKFKRKITVTQSGDVLTVEVTVFWGKHQVTAKEKIYNWY